MTSASFFLKTLTVAGSLAICVIAAMQAEWLWSAYFLIYLLERLANLKDEMGIDKAPRGETD